jgi:hypothetical protein
VRRDLRSLSQAELDDYRMRVDARFAVADAAPDAPGQLFFGIHGDWCLHYQEAFVFWHRAYLMRFEQEIGCPVPYWNWYAANASVDGDPSAGLPQAFKDETYVHPVTGETRANPLRFSAARNGISKACAGGPRSPMDCRWVQRDPLLYTSGDQDREARTAKIAGTLLFQQQVERALAFTDFSHPEGVGRPWADIQTFDPPPPDSDYVYRDYDFDGAYEQPHDNYHGWVGPDMADNSYTAFDPVFWSYHANIDRIFEQWRRAHPAATVTGGFPLQPFVGPRAELMAFDDPRRFVYTTIGDLAKDSRSLGYDFAPPVDQDFGQTANAVQGAASTATTGTAAVIPADEWLVMFDGVRCTHDSYAVDLFIDQPDATPADAVPRNAHYVGRLTRIGMGQIDEHGRCITRGVPRIVDATAVVTGLGRGDGPSPGLTAVVTDLATGAVLTPEARGALPGFEPRLIRTRDGIVPRRARSAAAAPSCCSTSSRA